MPTLLDSFVLELGWDTKPLEKGRKEAESNIAKTKESFVKAGKQMEDSAKAVASGISKVATEILALYAVITGASSLKGFITDLISANTQLGNFATTIGDSPQAIDAWGKAAERVGGNASATAGSFQRIADALNALRTQGQALPLAFYQLMEAAHTPIDTEHGPVAFMEGLARATRVLARTDPSKAAFLLKSIGIDQGTIALMLQGGPALDAYVKSLEKLAPTPAQIKASQDLLAAWTTLSQTAASLGNQILPTLDKVITPVLNSWAQWVDQNRDLVNSKIDEVLRAVVEAIKSVDWAQVSAGLGSFASSADQVASGIRAIADAMKTVNDYGETFNNVLKRLQNPFGLGPAPGPIWNRNRDQNPFGQSGGSGGTALSPGDIGNLGKIDGTRASGGPVGSGGTYLIGERGPELLHLGSQSGGISPNSALSGDIQVDGRPVNRANPLPISVVNMGNDIKDMFFGGDANLGYAPGGNNMGSGGGGRPRHPGSGGYGSSRGGSVPDYNPQAGTPGQYRPVYKLGNADLSDAVVNTINGEATSSQLSTDAVINNLFNRLGTHVYGPSGDLQQIARAPGQYAGYRVADAKRAAFIRDRIRAIASGAVPDVTNGATEYRAGWYRGPWYRKHANDPVIGGNRFGINPMVRGSYSPYPSGAGAAAKARGSSVGVGGGGQNMSAVSHETNVNGPITIHTQARDARGIAVALSDQIRRTTMTSTANYGPA